MEKMVVVGNDIFDDFMLDAFGMAQKMDTIKEWYDGYVFGNTEVFCPWDVANYGMLNGIFTSGGYSLDSNDEAGLGRLDLRVRDRKNRRLILMEFKRSAKEADMDGDCDKAIEQIVKKGYDKFLPEGYEDQRVYGIAFYAKRARVKSIG